MLGKSLVPCVLMLGKSLVWAEPPVSPQSLNDQSAWLKGEADKADVNNPLVKAVLGNGFQYFEQDASTATYKYSADKSEALVPFLQQVVGATDAVKDDVAASIIGAEWVTDGGGVKWKCPHCGTKEPWPKGLPKRITNFYSSLRALRRA